MERTETSLNGYSGLSVRAAVVWNTVRGLVQISVCVCGCADSHGGAGSVDPACVCVCVRVRGMSRAEWLEGRPEGWSSCRAHSWKIFTVTHYYVCWRGFFLLNHTECVYTELQPVTEGPLKPCCSLWLSYALKV